MHKDGTGSGAIRSELDALLAQARRQLRRAILMVVDVDRLKEVNAVFGYAAGDILLTTLGQRVGVAVPGGAGYRMGGDRFVITRAVGDENPVAVAEESLRNVTAPIQIGPSRLVPQASGGIAIFPDHGTDADQLMHRAELALDSAKQGGGGRVVAFVPDMESSVTERKRIEGELERAIRCREFDLHFQPQFALSDGRVVGTEALLRWPRRPGGPLPPGLFVPVAERSGLIRPIGAWLVDEACRIARDWYDDGGGVPVSINVSVAQLRQQDVAQIVARALTRYRLPAELLEIEVTESLFVDPAQVIIGRNIEHLSRLGVRLAIDDFGTGYSSLAYLKRLPAHRIKVDKTFVSGVGRDATDEALMGTIVGLGRLFGKRVLAEGVETDLQRDILAREGCHEAQGFLLAKPMPADQCAAFLRTVPEDRLATA